jgi:hypothetical protein
MRWFSLCFRQSLESSAGELDNPSDGAWGLAGLLIALISLSRVYRGAVSTAYWVVRLASFGWSR